VIILSPADEWSIIHAGMCGQAQGEENGNNKINQIVIHIKMLASSLPTLI
jgi:hypothetical protein